MPRIIRGQETRGRATRFPTLVDELAHELEHRGESGQPVIEEERFTKSGKRRVSVLWDKWDDLTFEDRACVILDAYEKAEGKDAKEDVALAIGLTFLEAYEQGLLPVQVVPLHRRGDPVTLEDCYRAMREEGASLLLSPLKPELRFATEEDATAGIRRLVRRLPGSEPIWAAVKEVGRIIREGGAERYFPHE